MELKERFISKKEKIYYLSREVREFIQEQMRKRYIWPSKSLQMASMFFVEKKDRKKRIVQNYQYLNK